MITWWLPSYAQKQQKATLPDGQSRQSYLSGNPALQRVTDRSRALKTNGNQSYNALQKHLAAGDLPMASKWPNSLPGQNV